MRSTVATLLTLATSALVLPAQKTPAIDSAWTGPFVFERGELSSSGRNPYFTLEAGHVRTLEGGGTRLVISVLADTKLVDGVETRVVEERESDKGDLVEVSRNYFAISKRTNSVYYFGEDVDMYKSGKVTSHEGTWLAGLQGAKPGIWIPGEPLLRAKYYQEIAPGIALDRGEIVSMTESVTTPAGKFTNVVKIEETTPLEPGVKEYKYFARGVGLIQDGDLKLTSHPVKSVPGLPLTPGRQ
jgi:hypothetical protein